REVRARSGGKHQGQARRPEQRPARLARVPRAPHHDHGEARRRASAEVGVRPLSESPLRRAFLFAVIRSPCRALYRSTPCPCYTSIRIIRVETDRIHGSLARRPKYVSKGGEAARRAGAFFMVQVGRDPDNWKPMSVVGRGAREIRVRDQSGAFRVIYVATLRSAVYVLHAFQKKTQTTGRDEIELAKRRYKEAAAMQSNA